MQIAKPAGNLSPSIQKRVDDALNVKFAGTVYLAALQELKKDGKITADPNTADATTNAPLGNG